MNKKVKKMLSCLAISTCMITTGLVAFAETVSFDVYANRTESFVSAQKAEKASGSAYENRFYVTPHSTPTGGTMNVWSQQCDDPSVKTDTVFFSTSNLWTTSKKDYVKTALPYYQYQLHGKDGYTAGGQMVRYKGNYTP